MIELELLITNYYDSLINRLDIYTEKRVNEYKEKEKKISQPINDSFQSTNTYGVKSFNNPYDHEPTEDMFIIDPKSFADLGNLKSLDLKDNKLSHFDLDIIDSIRVIEKLNLSGNPIDNKDEILKRFNG